MTTYTPKHLATSDQACEDALSLAMANARDLALADAHAWHHNHKSAFLGPTECNVPACSLWTLAGIGYDAAISDVRSQQLR